MLSSLHVVLFCPSFNTSLAPVSTKPSLVRSANHNLYLQAVGYQRPTPDLTPASATNTHPTVRFLFGLPRRPRPTSTTASCVYRYSSFHFATLTRRLLGTPLRVLPQQHGESTRCARPHYSRRSYNSLHLENLIPTIIVSAIAKHPSVWAHICTFAQTLQYKHRTYTTEVGNTTPPSRTGL